VVGSKDAGPGFEYLAEIVLGLLVPAKVVECARDPVPETQWRLVVGA
jgi:hypothetical protein